MNIDKKSLDYMTNLRGFAILMIVMVHCVTTFLSREDSCYLYVYSLFANSTDVFLFISGFLFEYLLHKEYTYKTFMLKKIKRLIIPYIFWAFPVALIFFVKKDFDINYLIYTMFTGLNHLNDAHWYIPFIFILFTISPILTFFQKRNVLYTVLLPIFLFISLTSNRAVVNEIYPVVMILNLLGFFILGMFFSHYRDFLLDKFYKLDWLLILCGLFICYFSSYYDLGSPKPVLESIVGYFHGKVYINWYATNRLFLSIGLLFFFYRLDKGGFNSLILRKLAHYSFGIYFCHMYIIIVLTYAMERFYNISGGIFHLILCFLFVLCLSIVLVYVLRRTHLTRNIIGV